MIYLWSIIFIAWATTFSQFKVILISILYDEAI